VAEHLDDVDEAVDPQAADAPESMESESARPFDADTILDTLVPQSIDWRGTVRRHPFGTVAAVGLVGYLVGRTKGAAIMAGMTAGISTALTRQLSDVFEGDFFDF
jgi:hypothetical protein